MMIAFHKQSTMKQKIYENILARQSGMDYSTGIRFEKILVYIDKVKALNKNNQPEKSNQK